MVGIKDIAQKAGVSISTVSYALNGSPKVTEETRARIQADRKRIELCSEHGCSHTETQTNQHHRCLSRRLCRKFLWGIARWHQERVGTFRL